MKYQTKVQYVEAEQFDGSIQSAQAIFEMLGKAMPENPFNGTGELRLEDGRLVSKGSFVYIDEKGHLFRTMGGIFLDQYELCAKQDIKRPAGLHLNKATLAEAYGIDVGAPGGDKTVELTGKYEDGELRIESMQVFP